MRAHRRSAVYFANNRNPNQEKTNTYFLRGFSNTGLGNLRFGKAEVSIGKLDSKLIQIMPNNPKEGSEALFDELRQSMKADTVDSLIFIHGYNVAFKEALESAVKMGDRYAKGSGDDFSLNLFVF